VPDGANNQSNRQQDAARQIPLRPRRASPVVIVCRQILAESRDRFLLALLGKSTNLPWMKYREIEIIRELLTALKPARCLEWGAGYSTLLFPAQLEKGAQWLSVEHDEEWARRIQTQNQRPNVRVILAAPNRPDWAATSRDGTYEDFRNYIEYPTPFAPFDFILVDGRARNACLSKAQELLTARGVVVLHDANRTSYHEAFPRFAHQLFFGDGRRQGGVWVGSTGIGLTDLLDLDTHDRVWRIHRGIRKLTHLKLK